MVSKIWGYAQFARLLKEPQQSIPYLFFRVAQGDREYSSYRDLRLKLLDLYTEVCRLRDPTLTRVLGIAFNSSDKDDESVDFILKDFDDWDEERERRAREIAIECDWEIDARRLGEYRRSDSEFPERQSEKHLRVVKPKTGSKSSGPSEQKRKARRKQQKASRKKQRKKR